MEEDVQKILNNPKMIYAIASVFLFIAILLAANYFQQVKIYKEQPNFSVEYEYTEKIPLYYNLTDNKTYTRNDDYFEEVIING